MKYRFEAICISLMLGGLYVNSFWPLALYLIAREVLDFSDKYLIEKYNKQLIQSQLDELKRSIDSINFERGLKK